MKYLQLCAVMLLRVHERINCLQSGLLVCVLHTVAIKSCCHCCRWQYPAHVSKPTS